MNYKKQSIRDCSFQGKKVLLRVDFNLPLDPVTHILTNDKRVRAALPTINYILSHGAALIMCSHLGKPKKDPNYRTNLTMRPIAEHFSEIIGREVIFSPEIIGEDAKAKAAALQPGEILFLENLRFDPREEACDEEFSRELASMADVFVSDAFGTLHRNHASIAGVAKYLPAYCGFLTEKELATLGGAIEDPQRPLVAVLGGAKISDKLAVIENLLNKADTLIIGGGMAFTFLKAKGYEIGNSLLDETKIDYCREMLDRAGDRIVLPVDVIAAERFAYDATTACVPVESIPDEYMGMDIGPKSRKLFDGIIKGAGTVIWNGPMGVFEFDAFAEGTKSVARSLAECRGITVVGGGDSVHAIEKMGFANKVTHVSTGGGVTLELMEGKDLPGVACLLDVKPVMNPEKKFRKTIIAGNWKMNMLPSQVKQFIHDLRPIIPQDMKGLAAVLCVPATHIAPLAYEQTKRVRVGAQNVSQYAEGAHTGDVSGEMLKDLGVEYCIVGHSERRLYHGTTDKLVHNKIRSLLDNGITPIVCVGESAEQREYNLTNEWIAYQVKASLYSLTPTEVGKCVIAYEPIWAIGTGKTATTGEAEEVCFNIRQLLFKNYGAKVAREMSILYGGSMNAENCRDLLSQPDIDGGLIGGASLKSDDFAKILSTAVELEN